MAGGAEARAGCGVGRASARAADLACPVPKLENLRPEEKYKHTLSHKLQHICPGYEIYTLNQLHFDGEFCENFWPYQSFLCKFKAITLVNASAKAFPSYKGPGKPEWALICPTKYFYLYVQSLSVNQITRRK